MEHVDVKAGHTAQADVTNPKIMAFKYHACRDEAKAAEQCAARTAYSPITQMWALELSNWHRGIHDPLINMLLGRVVDSINEG